MRRGTALLICALFCRAGGESLITSKLRGGLPNNEPQVNTSHSDTVEKGVIRNHTVAEEESIAAAKFDAAHYCGCNSTACGVDTAKVEHDFDQELVLILGCSLDINAIEWFCNSVGAPVLNFKTKNQFSYLAHCNVGKFTVAYAFHPGASPAPYFSEYAGTATTFDVVKNSVHDVQLQFGRQPTAIVVDASLWDVSNWWEKHGRPADPYPVPLAEIGLWCNRYVPNLLNWVQKQYPSAGIAFRTMPTVFPNNGYGQNADNIETMVKCIDQQLDPLGRLYGKYAFIDYHHFVDQVLDSAAGPPMQTYYKDSLHPGQSLSLMYMNRVLNWVRGIPVFADVQGHQAVTVGLSRGRTQ